MTPEQFKALRTAEDNLTAVLCDPEGKCCISGSDADRRIIDDALDILRALAAEPAPCAGNDPLCPCQDGDACHYRDSGETKAWPVPEHTQKGKT